MPTNRRVIVIGGSSGSLSAACRLLAPLPSDFPVPILAALDTRPLDGNRDMVGHLAEQTQLRVSYAKPGESPLPGHVYLAPKNFHLVLNANGTLGLDEGPKVSQARPAADPLFETAAAAYGPRVIGVVLSGEDHNGMDGLKAIHAARGVCIIQSPSDAIVPAMPMNALMADHTDHCVLLDEMPHLLISLVKQHAR